MSASDFLRFRQIHLDFHTSEAISNIGGEFDAGAWADQLAAAAVDSITCFARCHHGWIYYETARNPERRHPHLQRNLLVEQIEAAHARNIRAPIYTTVMWDHYTAERHPEWLQLDADGRIRGTPPYEAGFYRWMCLNSPYRDFLKAHVTEICEMAPAVDGLFFDIVHAQECSCQFCKAGMLAQGLDPADPQARKAYGVQVLYDFVEDMTRHVRQYSPDGTIFYNGGHIGPLHRPVADAYSHWELESLPSGGWGYMHFPLAMRYARTLGKDCLGMTGKFHTSWGDFHSYKNPAALQFECFQMLALGAKCSIGDQLHPTGRLDDATYELIGPVYREVAAKEPWCRGAQPVAEIGVFTPEEFTGERLTPQTIGAIRMLQECGYQFDILDAQSDLSVYKLLILPDRIPTAPDLAARLGAFVEAGGSLIASFASGMNAQQTAFALPGLGVTLAGEGGRDAQGKLVRGRHFPRGDYLDYLRPGPQFGRGLPAAEYAMYMRGMRVAADAGAEVLAETVQSYFDRTWQHFCSHRQTPSAGEVLGPAVVRRGRMIYIAHPIFAQYHQNAPRWCKQLLTNAIDLLLPEPLVRHGGPSALLVSVNAQAAEARWVVHLLYYVPERRGEDFDVIEDVVPLFDLPVAVRTPGPATRVRTVPQGEDVPFTSQDGRTAFTLRRLDGHQMVEIQL
jgi:hypothetical protein